RQLGISRAHEVAMQRVHMPIRLHGALGRNQRLRYGLTAEHALPVAFRAATTEQIVLQPLEVENGKKLVHGGRHHLVPCLVVACDVRQDGHDVKAAVYPQAAGREVGRCLEQARRQKPRTDCLTPASSTCSSQAPDMSVWPAPSPSNMRVPASGSPWSTPRRPMSGRRTTVLPQSPPPPAACWSSSTSGTAWSRTHRPSPR